MSEVPAELRYTPEHEWIRIEGDIATIGVTDYAQDALTDVVWVELPEVGMSVGAMESCGSVESVSYTHLRAHETSQDLVCRLLLEKKNFQFPVEEQL